MKDPWHMTNAWGTAQGLGFHPGKTLGTISRDWSEVPVDPLRSSEGIRLVHL